MKHTSNHRTAGSPAYAGFTLIKFLVGIAIIAILALMPLPALSSSKQAAFWVKCINGLKQSTVAATMYADDSQQHIPHGFVMTGTPKTPVNTALILDAGIAGSAAMPVSGFSVIADEHFYVPLFTHSGRNFQPTASNNHNPPWYNYASGMAVVVCFDGHADARKEDVTQTNPAGIPVYASTSSSASALYNQFWNGK